MCRPSSTILGQNAPWGDFGFAFSRSWCANGMGSVRRAALGVRARLPALLSRGALGGRRRRPRRCVRPRVRLITTTCSPRKRQVVSKPTLGQRRSLGTALEAKRASAREVCPQQLLLSFPLPAPFSGDCAASACSASAGFAAGSAVCSDFLPSLELVLRFPKFQKRNQQSPN